MVEDQWNIIATKKMMEDRRNREQISEIESPFSLDDLIKPKEDEHEIQIYHDQKYENKLQIEDDDDMEDDNIPILPPHDTQRKSVLLDINSFSTNLVTVIEEDDDEEDDDEGHFQTVEYQTDSDCDSNDSVVVKKEIFKEVTCDDLVEKDT